MALQEKSPATGIDPKERRRYPRNPQPHTAEVRIQHADGDVASQAVVINSSVDGMCIRHWHKDLSIGETARVSSPSFPEMLARVVWHWSVGPMMISGLQKIKDHPEHALPQSVHMSIDSKCPTMGNLHYRKHAKVHLRLLGVVAGVAAGMLLAAGWHFRNTLWRLWSLS